MGLDEYLDSDDPKEFDELETFEEADILYSIQKLIEAGYLNATNVSGFSRTTYHVTSVTWE